ncbi:uncharacterized protein [Typha latifolia]|uniref:uncharacterized protein isoform X4 n=1 Tax=Typha latifolia TaxID=4733 RepID=UPI003C2DFF5C
MGVRIPSYLRSPALLLSSSRAEWGVTVRSMSSSSQPSPLPYTTLRERARCERETKKSKFIAIAAPVSDERSAHSFLAEVRDPRATHNCWAYKFRSNDDGEPSGTAGKPIYSAIVSSGVDMVMVVVIRAYGGVALECLKGASTCLVKPKAPIGMEVPFDLLGTVYHQLQSFQVEDIKQDYDTGKDGITMVTFRVEYDKIESLENAINSTCSRKIEFYKH